MIRRMLMFVILIGAGTVMATTALVRVSAVEVTGTDISLERCQAIRGTADECTRSGPDTWCGEEEYCAENACTGDPFNNGGTLVRNCQKVNLHNITLIWDWYTPCLQYYATGFYAYCDYGKCKRKCNCSDYCTDHDPRPEFVNWVCDSTSTCVDTGNFYGILWFLGTADCPPPNS